RLVRLGEDPLPDDIAWDHVWVLVDRIEAGKTPSERVADSVETAFARGGGRVALLRDEQEMIFDRRLVCPRCNILYPDLEPRLFSFNDPLGACPTCQGTGLAAAGKRGRTEAPGVCPTCRGTRLNEQARIAQIGGRTIADLSAQTAAELSRFFAELTLPDAQRAAGKVLIEQIKARLGFMIDVELGYLTLDRAAETLSTGEGQRVRLTTALGSNLVNALYILEEPTTGLHPRDVGPVQQVLQRLRDAGNTLLLVEHRLEVIRNGDYVIDLGPGAGEEGGEVIYQGTPAGLAEDETSITGGYLEGRRAIAVPRRRRELSHGSLRLLGATTNNLQNLTVDFPLGVL